MLLSPGTAQVYYGDEVSRSLVIEETVGDATLRSVMNWNDMNAKQEILNHWYKLGQFRRNHPAVGAGKHELISKSPFVFSRSYSKGDYHDAVVVALDLPDGENKINVSSTFKDGDQVIDYYSGQKMTVENGEILSTSSHKVVLLQKI